MSLAVLLIVSESLLCNRLRLCELKWWWFTCLRSTEESWSSTEVVLANRSSSLRQRKSRRWSWWVLEDWASFDEPFWAASVITCFITPTARSPSAAIISSWPTAVELLSLTIVKLTRRSHTSDPKPQTGTETRLLLMMPVLFLHFHLANFTSAPPLSIFRSSLKYHLFRRCLYRESTHVTPVLPEKWL